MSVTTNDRRVLRVGEVAAELGLPGPWTLRRLEERGIIPPAHRSLARGDRFYRSDEVKGLRDAIAIPEGDLE